MADEIENARPKGLLIPFDKLKLLDILDDAAFRQVFRAMAAYVKTGTETDGMEPIEQVAFESMRPFLDENIKTYQRAVIAHREAGRKGGRPKKKEENQEASEETKENQKEPNGFSEEPSETNSPQSTKYKVQTILTYQIYLLLLLLRSTIWMLTSQKLQVTSKRCLGICRRLSITRSRVGGRRSARRCFCWPLTGLLRPENGTGRMLMALCVAGSVTASRTPQAWPQAVSNGRAASNKATGLEMPGSLLKM